MCSERQKNLAVFLPTILVLSTSTSINRTYVWPNRPIRSWKRSTLTMLSLAKLQTCDRLVISLCGKGANHTAKAGNEFSLYVYLLTTLRCSFYSRERSYGLVSDALNVAG